MDVDTKINGKRVILNIGVLGDSATVASLLTLKRIGHLPEKYQDTNLSKLDECEARKILDETSRTMRFAERLARSVSNGND